MPRARCQYRSEFIERFADPAKSNHLFKMKVNKKSKDPEETVGLTEDEVKTVS